MRATARHYQSNQRGIDMYVDRELSIEMDDDIIRFETAGTAEEADLDFGSAGVSIEMSFADAHRLGERLIGLTKAWAEGR